MHWIDFTAPTADVLLGATVILVLRIVGVTISTVRMLVMMRGHKMAAVALGFFEVLTYILAIGKVTHDLGNIWNILGYCLGFCVGTLAGMSLHDRLVLGHSIVRITSRDLGKKVLDAIHASGFGATMETGAGREGNVAIITSVLRAREVPAVCDIAHAADPKSFITVEEARTVMRGYLRAGQREK